MTTPLQPGPTDTDDVHKGVLSLTTLKWLIGTLTLPVVLAVLGHFYNNASDARALRDGRIKAYSELMNKREQADMDMRSKIFSTLLGNYFTAKDGSTSLSQRFTELELLSLNFDESLNLSPLFWQLERDVEGSAAADAQPVRDQLSRLASRVKDRQIMTLGGTELPTDWHISLAAEKAYAPTAPKRAGYSEPALRRDAQSAECLFTVQLIDRDPVGRRVYALVQSDAVDKPLGRHSPCRTEAEPPQPRQWSFWVDEFDFPLLTYTRFSDHDRFALVLREYNEDQATVHVTLVFFPSSRAGVRDRPYLDTVMNTLGRPTDADDAPAQAASGSAR